MASTQRRNSALLMPAMKGHRFDDASGSGPGRGTGFGLIGRGLAALLRAAAKAVTPACILVFGGFALFATHVSQLSTPDDPEAADAIIVLTGGQARLDAALDLLKSGKGERLLISGVHPSTSRKSLQAATGGDDALFACCVDIDRAALDTIGNAEESVKWVRTHDYRRVILVTNNYHMPRSLLELGRLLDREQLDPYPVVNANLDKGEWMVRPEALRVLFTEYGKYLVALVRGLLPQRPADEGDMTVVSAPADATD
ncbi:YdcF family protein [Mesorhizobium sp. ZMM04-5]|uniref:YdcF family protein n=2 Tax=Mesorhizobium marinum TaxID=3228790 RepID=A0ABV3QX18_9HYPH